MIVFFTHHFLNFENAWVIFILSDCTENWISNMGVGYIIPKIILMLRLGTILLKNVLNVSATSSLFVIVLLLFFDVVHSLWKVFSTKRGLIVFQNFLSLVAILLFKFCSNSLSYFYAKNSRRDFFVYYRDFSLHSFFHVNICFEVLTF